MPHSQTVQGQEVACTSERQCGLHDERAQMLRRHCGNVIGPMLGIPAKSDVQNNSQHYRTKLQCPCDMVFCGLFIVPRAFQVSFRPTDSKDLSPVP